jgi:hypothetical protein
MKLIIGSKDGRTGNNLIVLANLFSTALESKTSKVVHFGLPEIGLSEDPHFQELQKWTLIQGNRYELVNENLREYKNKFAGETVLKMLDTKFRWSEISQAREILIQFLSLNLDFRRNPSIGNVIHIRGGDLFVQPRFLRTNLIHSDYTALPVDFYSEILMESDEIWTFLMEPKTPIWYQNLLRKSFPKHHFKIGTSVKADFQYLLSSKKIAIAVSTFSWSAAFLGNQDKIYFPRTGFLNMDIRPDIDLRFRLRNVAEFEIEKHFWTGRRSEKEWLVGSKVRLT